MNRTLIALLILSIAIAPPTHALEMTAAGKDGGYEAAVGFNSAIEMVRTVINKILACQKNGQDYSSLTDSCGGLTTAQETAMLNCMKAGNTYNVTSGACVPAGKPTINYAACTWITNAYPDTYLTELCPANTVMTGFQQQGLATGSKVWYGRYRCCPFN